MPKLKTHKGAAKRFKKTGSGGYKRKSACVRHGFTKKDTKRKRHLRGLSMVGHSELAAVKQMLGDS